MTSQRKSHGIRKTNKQGIYQTTYLPSFVTFDAFYFCLWPKTLRFERHLGGKALATDHRVYTLTHIVYARRKEST